MASVAVAGSALASMAACGSSATSPDGSTAPQLTSLAGSVAGRVVTVTVAASGPLGSVGGAALITSSLGSFLAARTGQDTVTVLTATCTHEACTVSGFESSQFVCPCHGSRYTTAGAVVTGPAPRALATFASTLVNGTLTFSA